MGGVSRAGGGLGAGAGTAQSELTLPFFFSDPLALLSSSLASPPRSFQKNKMTSKCGCKPACDCGAESLATCECCCQSCGSACTCASCACAKKCCAGGEGCCSGEGGCKCGESCKCGPGCGGEAKAAE